MREPKSVETLRRVLAGLPANRSGAAVAMIGQAGIGKSHSVNRLRAGLTYRTAVVSSTESIDQLLSALPPVQRLPRWSGRALEVGNRGPIPTEEALTDALVARLAASAPFALFVEDLHEATPERKKLWAAVASEVGRSRRVALVVTSREQCGKPFQPVAVEPLTREEVKALLEAEVAAELPDAAIEWIGGRAAGNPLFALEFFRHLARQGFLWTDTRRWRWREPEVDRLPGSIEALISHRLRSVRRTEAHELVIGALALVRGLLDPSDLPSVVSLSQEETEAVLGDLRASGFLVGNGFAHPLYREVALQVLSPERRRLLARSAVEILRSEPMRASHLVADAGLPAQESLDLLMEAAGQARLGRDSSEYARLLAAASAYAGGERREELELKAANVYRRTNLPIALELVQRITSRKPNHVEALFLQSELLVLLGRDEEARGLMERLSGHEETRLRWHRTNLILHAERGDFAAAVDLWRSHPDLRSGAPPRVVRSAAFSLQQLGELAEAEEILTATLDAARPMSDIERAELLHVQGAAHFYRGEYVAAEQAWAEVTTLLQDTDENVLRARALGNRASACRSIGLFRKAISLAQEAVDIFSDLGLGRDYSRQRLSLAALLRSQAEFERAEEILLECREVFIRVSDRTYLIATELELAFLYLAWEPPYSASLTLRHAHASLELARDAGLPHLTNQALSLAAWAEARFNDPALARPLVEEALESSRRLGQPQGIRFAIWVRGHVNEALGRTDAALADFRESARLEEEAGNFLHAQDQGLEADRLTGDEESARQRLEIFRRHDMKSMELQVHRYFPQIAAGDPRRADPDPLNLEVLGPLRLGRSGMTLDYRARKGRELLVRLLAARMEGRGEVDQLALQEALYPGLPDSRASAALQQLVYRLRNALGSDVVLRTQDGYMLGSVRSDAEAFLESGDGQLWRGDFLEGLAEDLGSTVRSALYRALREAADSALESSPAEAARLARLLVAAEPYELGHLRLALRAMEANGESAAATRMYATSRREFAEVGEALPEDWRHFLTGTGNSADSAER